MSGNDLVHGDLHVEIKKAVHLYNGENLGVPFFGRLVAKFCCLKIDPYVNIKLGEVKLGSSSRLKNTIRPKFNETYKFKLCHSCEGEGGRNIILEVKDKNVSGAMMIGSCTIPFDDVINAKDHTLEPKDGFPLDHPKKGKHGRIFARFRFHPHDRDAPDALSPEVNDVYFSHMSGNRVRLYQSAANTPDIVPPYIMPSGNRFPIHTCWDDLYHAITAAQKFIYIVGWSVHPECRLIRDDPNSKGIGELLKAAADRGVQVKVLVWDDRSSLSVFGKAFMGAMGTFDEQCRTWFKQNAPKVQCQVVPREGHNALSTKESAIAATCFSHHQKAVVCDCEGANNGGRGICAFLGGIDITMGRYDNGQHNLFPTDGRYEGDWYQSSFNSKLEDGKTPRQPWQDIHCRIEGPAAMDICLNFLERWTEQIGTGSKGAKRPEELGCKAQGLDGKADEAFTVQLSRSIDTQSAALDVTRQDMLLIKKGVLVDQSILLTYIHHIRRAERFVYIENQYFFGSCFMWTEAQDCGCNHTIPAELVQKILEKIRAKQRFCVYITTPMYPEGDPSTDANQQILRFSRLTREAMYRSIHKELKAQGSSAPVTDYLMFFCLGNRDAGPQEPPVDSDGQKAQESQPGILSAINRRHMIYVHSKFMVVDDEVAIIGSANLNMRSLAGDRDSEIAVAMWQPAHMLQRPIKSDDPQLPRGDVHGFRMSVWSEHFDNGNSEEGTKAMMDPGTVDCMHRVQELAAENWRQYVSGENVRMVGHLMTYPFSMPECGVSYEPEVDHIPDFPDAPFQGKGCMLPDVLTT